MQGGTEKEQGTRVQDEQQDNPTNPFHSQSSRLQVSGLESLPSRTRHLTPPPPRQPHPSIPYHTSGRSSPISSPSPGAQISAAPLPDPPTPSGGRHIPRGRTRYVRSRLFRPLARPRRLGSPIRVLLCSALLLDSRQQSSRRALRRTHAHVCVANPAAEGSGLALLHHR